MIAGGEVNCVGKVADGVCVVAGGEGGVAFGFGFVGHCLLQS